jgi:hypothetical protein
MCKFATRLTALFLFGIASFFGSTAQAVDFPNSVSPEELLFLIQIGMVNEADLYQPAPLSQQWPNKATSVTQKQSLTVGLSGTDMGSGRIRGVSGMDLGSGR